MKLFTFCNCDSVSEHVWVEWDLNSVACRYRFGSKGMYDIIEEDNQPRILKPDELIEIGCRVRRGTTSFAHAYVHLVSNTHNSSFSGWLSRSS